MNKKASLLGTIKAERAPIRNCGNAAQRLPPKILEELRELRRAYQAGSLVGWNAEMLFERVNREFKLPISAQTFRVFMRATDAET